MNRNSVEMVVVRMGVLSNGALYGENIVCLNLFHLFSESIESGRRNDGNTRLISLYTHPLI